MCYCSDLEIGRQRLNESGARAFVVLGGASCCREGEGHSHVRSSHYLRQGGDYKRHGVITKWGREAGSPGGRPPFEMRVRGSRTHMVIVVYPGREQGPLRCLG